MNLVKIFTTFILILAFAFISFAQTQNPKIIWINMQEQYEQSMEVEPIIVNESDKAIFFTNNSVILLRFEEKTGQWIPSDEWICGNAKTQISKLRKGARFYPSFDKLSWMAKFISFSKNLISAKYKFEFNYTDKTIDANRNLIYYTSFSPEFSVTNSDQ